MVRRGLPGDSTAAASRTPSCIASPLAPLLLPPAVLALCAFSCCISAETVEPLPVCWLLLLLLGWWCSVAWCTCSTSAPASSPASRLLPFALLPSLLLLRCRGGGVGEDATELLPCRMGMGLSAPAGAWRHLAGELQPRAPVLPLLLRDCALSLTGEPPPARSTSAAWRTSVALGDLTRHGDCSRCSSEACLGLAEGESWLEFTSQIRSCSNDALP